MAFKVLQKCIKVLFIKHPARPLAAAARHALLLVWDLLEHALLAQFSILSSTSYALSYLIAFSYCSGNVVREPEETMRKAHFVHGSIAKKFVQSCVLPSA